MKSVMSEICQEMCKNELTKDMLPLKSDFTDMNTRLREKFQVHHANTDRFKKSPIIYMQHLLNIDYRTPN